MVSFYQAQCLNCGTIDDVVRMDASGNESWCSQCGFTRLPARQQANMMQNAAAAPAQHNSEDEQLAALLSRNMFLSDRHILEEQERVQRLQEQQQRLDEIYRQQEAEAVYLAEQERRQQEQEQEQQQQQQQQQKEEEQPRVNTYVSQHYIHYYPPPAAAPVQAAPAPAPAPVASPATPPPNSSTQFTYIQHLLTTSPNPEAALLDYHRSLSVMEEHYHQRLGRRPSADAPAPPSPTHSASSATSEDDYQLQLIMLEQSAIQAEAAKLRQQRLQRDREAQEQQQRLQQVQQQHQQHLQMLAQMPDQMAWTGGHPMPTMPMEMHNGVEVGGKIVDPGVQQMDMGGAAWGEMSDEESPCSMYYSRAGRY